MGTASDYFENLIISQLVRNATKYLAVFTTSPNFETGASGVEATGGGYARKAIAFDAPVTPGVTQNTSLIEWTLGTDIAADDYLGWGVFDALSGGNMLFGDAFGSNRTLTDTGDKLRFAAGAITYAGT